ncbi:MAG: hypothetical protein ACUVRJ_11210, partial [Candidatus Villigracilaceae bacterium]
ALELAQSDPGLGSMAREIALTLQEVEIKSRAVQPPPVPVAVGQVSNLPYAEAAGAGKGAPFAALQKAPQRAYTQVTILQEDTEATRDQGAEAASPPVFPPRPSPTQPARTWLWWLPVGIVALLLIVCGTVVGVIWITNGGLLAKNQPVETQPAGPTLPGNVTISTNPAPSVATITQPETVISTAVHSATSTQIPTSTHIPTPTHTTSPTQPSPNPTGKIVFTCQMSRLSEFNEICLMNADGSHFRQLTSNGANNGYTSLSPDGQSVVYASNISGTWQIYEMNLSSGSTWQVTSGLSDAIAPEISPDGQEIVYRYSDPIDSIWVMNRDGSNPHKVYGPGWDPVWSPDGSQILFASGTVGQAQLYIINSNGSGLQQVTNQRDLPGRSDWSVGGLIAFYAGTAWNRNIFTMNSNGSGVIQITNSGNSLAPSFSPDGNWIAFTAYFDNMGDPNGCEIYIMRLDGSDRRRLTYNNYCDWQPRWGP